MELQLVETYGTEMLQTVRKVLSMELEDGTEESVINLYPDITYQTMEGFGGAITDAAGFVFAQMNERQQKEFLHRYFGKEQMNYRMVRMHMDSCDFSTHIYSADQDEEDADLSNFCFADTERYMIPLLRAAEKEFGAKLPIMLSPWSPPPFMKSNGQRKNGGKLKKEYYGRYAEYICRYIKEFRDRGFVVNRLSVQNEPKAVQKWDSCVYSAEEEKTFLRDYLYPALISHGMDDLEIFIWDHNKERVFERASAIIDETTDKMITGVAFHWYSGDHFDALRLIKEKFPEKKLILSESCLEFCKFEREDEIKNAAKLAHDMMGNLNHGMNSFYDWNILLDEKGGPNHVSGFCDAPFLYHQDTRELEEGKILRYYWHFSHFIKAGAVRIASSCYTSDLEVTAWKNPDGGIAFILLNRTGKELPFVLRLRGHMIKGCVKPFSISSSILTR